MAVSQGNYLKSFHDQARSMGRKSVNSDFTFEIEGHEGVYLLAKQCPDPVLSVGGEIEIATPLGTTMFEAQQTKVAMQGQVSFYETRAGHIDQLLVDLIAKGGYFNAKIYEGTPQAYLSYKRIQDCFIQIDAADRDWENRSQPLMFSGTMFFHYYGEKVDGNSKDYNP